MSHDALNCFSNNQTVAGAAGDIVYSEVMDFGAGNAGLQPAALVAKVRTAFTGSGNLQAVLQDSANGTDYADVLAGPVIAGASLIAGKKLFNSGMPADLRVKVRVAYKITSAALAAGTVDTNLQEAPETE